MGQYHLAVNLDKREFLNPHGLGDGLKLWEQAGNGEGGVGSALIALLACSNGRGGGDFQEENDTAGVIGRWAGDRIAIIGDYAEPEDLAPEHRAELIYAACRGKPAEGMEPFRDISEEVALLLGREFGLSYTGDGWRGRERLKQAPPAGELVPEEAILGHKVPAQAA